MPQKYVVRRLFVCLVTLHEGIAIHDIAAALTMQPARQFLCLLLLFRLLYFLTLLEAMYRLSIWFIALAISSEDDDLGIKPIAP